MSKGMAKIISTGIVSILLSGFDVWWSAIFVLAFYWIDLFPQECKD